VWLFLLFCFALFFFFCSFCFRYFCGFSLFFFFFLFFFSFPLFSFFFFPFCNSLICRRSPFRSLLFFQHLSSVRFSCNEMMSLPFFPPRGFFRHFMPVNPSRYLRLSTLSHMARRCPYFLPRLKPSPVPWFDALRSPLSFGLEG